MRSFKLRSEMRNGDSESAADDARAGVRILSVLANPLHVRVLRAHGSGPQRSRELSEKADWPPQTTLRAAMATLRRLGLLERRNPGDGQSGAATELTPAGEETVMVAAVVERWLAQAPRGPIAADSDAAKSAVKSLAGGWNSKIVRALADEPSSLTELDRRIPEISYPSLERRLARMRSTEQIERAPDGGRGTPYDVTDWLRNAVAPLCAAARCERRHLRAESAPITATEVEAAFLLAMPLVPLPTAANGVCVLSVLPEASESDGGVCAAGVTVAVERGAVVSCLPEVPENSPVWALGTPAAWLDAVIDGELAGLRFGDGRPQLSAYLVNGLHLALFGM